MSREIKFQFVIDNKEVSQSYTLDEILEGVDAERIIENMEVCDCSLNESNSSCQGDCIKYENSLITGKRQYTGLKDKNGREIYEGDILDYPGYNPIEVWFDDGAFLVGKKGESDQNIFQSKADHMNVIGNIYENPELLK